MNHPLTGMSIAVLVTDGFEQVEMTGPLQALEQADVTINLIGEKSGESPGQVRGYNHDRPAGSFPLDMHFEDADLMEFDAVLLPGGSRNGHHVCTIPAAQHFVQEIDEMDKPVAAICHGTLLLASAGLLEGRTLTSRPGIQEDMRQAGGNRVNQAVVVDGNLITSRKPDDVAAFSEQLRDAMQPRLHASVAGTRDEQPDVGPQG